MIHSTLSQAKEIAQHNGKFKQALSQILKTTRTIDATPNEIALWVSRSQSDFSKIFSEAPHANAQWKIVCERLASRYQISHSAVTSYLSILAKTYGKGLAGTASYRFIHPRCRCPRSY